MPDRAISISALKGMLAQQTDEVYLECITITHPSLAAPVRIVNNGEDVARTAGTFKAWPFKMQLPNDDDQQIPQVTLSSDMIDTSIGVQVQALRYPMPKVMYEVVTAAALNTVEAGPFDFDAISVKYSTTTMDATLGYEEDLLNEPFPGTICTPNNNPGQFS